MLADVSLELCESSQGSSQPDSQFSQFNFSNASSSAPESDCTSVGGSQDSIDSAIEETLAGSDNEDVLDPYNSGEDT